MRAVIQRVLRANVSVDGLQISEIGRGLCVLVGIQSDDTQEDLDYIARKIATLRLFSMPMPEDCDARDSEKPWSKSVTDLKLQVLLVSQFTLYARTGKGAKPDFHLSMKADQSREFYQKFLERMRQLLPGPEQVQDGKFGAMMQVGIVNDGPVTIILDSQSR